MPGTFSLICSKNQISSLIYIVKVNSIILTKVLASQETAKLPQPPRGNLRSAKTVANSDKTGQGLGLLPCNGLSHPLQTEPGFLIEPQLLQYRYEAEGTDHKQQAH